MSPDSAETRIGVLERIVARLEQKMEDISDDVRALAPLAVTVAEIRIALSRIEHLEEQRQRKDDERAKQAEQERETQARDARNFRRTLIGIGIAAILSPIGTLIVAVLSQ